MHGMLKMRFVVGMGTILTAIDCGWKLLMVDEDLRRHLWIAIASTAVVVEGEEVAVPRRMVVVQEEFLVDQNTELR